MLSRLVIIPRRLAQHAPTKTIFAAASASSLIQQRAMSGGAAPRRFMDPLSETPPDRAIFPREGPTLNYALNWSLCYDGVAPRKDVYYNGSWTKSSGEGAKAMEIGELFGDFQEDPAYMDVVEFLEDQDDLYVWDGGVATCREDELTVRIISNQYVPVVDLITKMPKIRDADFGKHRRSIVVLYAINRQMGTYCSTTLNDELLGHLPGEGEPGLRLFGTMTPQELWGVQENQGTCVVSAPTFCVKTCQAAIAEIASMDRMMGKDVQYAASCTDNIRILEKVPGSEDREINFGGAVRIDTKYPSDVDGKC
jgi:hypothetical protein